MQRATLPSVAWLSSSTVRVGMPWTDPSGTKGFGIKGKLPSDDAESLTMSSTSMGSVAGSDAAAKDSVLPCAAPCAGTWNYLPFY